MKAKPEKWYAVSVSVPPDHVEAVEFALNSLDSLGSEVEMFPQSGSALLTVTAYFSSLPDGSSVEAELRNAAHAYRLSPDLDFNVRHTVVEDQDWLAEWKKWWKPVEIGRFVIAAPWHSVEGDGHVIIRIEPNMAFGTGTHETTQLCLAAIDANYQSGQSMLDVGTGTGILAIAAAMTAGDGARIAAVDTDADAIAIARTNAELNAVGGRIEFSAGSLDAVKGRFDVVSANLTADVILPILADLIDRAAVKLILSGILVEQEEMVTSALPKPLSHTVTRAGEWVAIVVETGPGGSLHLARP